MSAKGWGFSGKLLRVDLTSRKAWEEEIDRDLAYRFLGAKGYGAYLLFKEVKGVPIPLARKTCWPSSQAR